MGIKRFTATSDNTITNAFEANLTTRGTGSNMGASDILEVFSIYAQASTGSQEASRALLRFPVMTTDDATNSIQAQRTAGNIPAAGKVNFYLKLTNARHSQTVPKEFTLVVSAVSRSWSEGTGLDMENYSDSGVSNWISASLSASTDDGGWTTEGGDYHALPLVNQTFDTGTENLEVDVTTLVEQWIAGSKTNYGFGIQLTSSEEDSTSRSYYTKKFFSRTSEYFFRRPMIEARFNDARYDNRVDFVYSSSLAPANDNLNTIWLYNRARSKLTNIPDVGTGNIGVSIYSGSELNTASGSALALVADGTHVRSAIPLTVTGGYVSTGVYSASFAITGASDPLSLLKDVWFKLDNSRTSAHLATQYRTGTINPSTIDAVSNQYTDRYINKITNLKPAYFQDEVPMLRLYSRPKDWQPTIYTVAKSNPQTTIIRSSSYSVYRMADDLRVINFGTGSDLATMMSYDASGNYFKLDMNMLESDYAYAIEVCHYNEYTADWEIQPEVFKFRVEKRQSR
tara:strand:- start:1193 stop:2728 length:1536 start_codon:yes stop_codon:yes gene_type:complete